MLNTSFSSIISSNSTLSLRPGIRALCENSRKFPAHLSESLDRFYCLHRSCTLADISKSIQYSMIISSESVVRLEQHLVNRLVVRFNSEMGFRHHPNMTLRCLLQRSLLASRRPTSWSKASRNSKGELASESINDAICHT